MIVRQAAAVDIPAIMAVLEAARGIMRASGNPSQWPDGYPTAAMVEEDLSRGVGHVFEADGTIAGYFACIPGPDPTYGYIEGGAWLDDTLPYYVVHRIASYPHVHGIFAGIIDRGFDFQVRDMAYLKTRRGKAARLERFYSETAASGLSPELVAHARALVDDWLAANPA